MYPSQFRYHRPSTLTEAFQLAAKLDGQVKFLAGGHSLIPMMKLRLAAPDHLIDLSGIDELKGIRVDQHISIGAMTTHWQVQSSQLLRERHPVISKVGGVIADPLVRNRGTIGGSLSHADPSADYPALMLALQGKMRCRDQGGEREVSADDWFLGLMTTVLREGEILTGVRIALPPPGFGAGYAKHLHPASRFALAGVAVALTLEPDGRCTAARVGLTGLAITAARAEVLEHALTGVQLNAKVVDDAANYVVDGVDVGGGFQVGLEDKCDLFRATARVAIRDAVKAAAPSYFADGFYPGDIRAVDIEGIGPLRNHVNQG
jgi:aerobic carbon-monoxide dehydrogenase medium subunit